MQTSEATGGGESAAGTQFQKNVRVCVRCRPFIHQETRKQHTGDLMCIQPDGARVTIRTAKDGSQQRERSFQYDEVLGPDTTQEQLFERCGVRQMVDKVAEGFHATVFAYGQTSSGKTYTMEGDISDPVHAGVIPRAVDSLFKSLNASGHVDYSVRASAP